MKKIVEILYGFVIEQANYYNNKCFAFTNISANNTLLRSTLWTENPRGRGFGW